jgi:pyruvate carboxylase
VKDVKAKVDVRLHPKADPRDWTQIGASMPGKVIQLLVQAGDSVHRGAPLLIAEAMKMETAVSAPRDSVVEEVLVRQGDDITPGDLLVRLAPVPDTEEI